MRWTAVINPGAGRRRRRRIVARLRDALAARAIDVHLTATAEAGLEAARAAFARGDGVLACGGDGTVRVLAALAAETGGLLGIVPLGSGNDFARELGFDHRDPLGMLRALDEGHEAVVDLGRARTADGRVELFTTVAQTGLDGEVNRWANTVTWASGTVLYVIAALRTMAVYQPTEMRVTTDDSAWEGRAWLVAVGNTHCYGGGMRIVPDASVTDGRLHGVIVGAVSRAELFARFPQMIVGAHLGVDGVVSVAGTTIRIEGPEGQDLHASGERVGPLPATLEAVPGALRVLVPATSPVARVTTP